MASVIEAIFDELLHREIKLIENFTEYYFDYSNNSKLILTVDKNTFKHMTICYAFEVMSIQNNPCTYYELPSYINLENFNQIIFPIFHNVNSNAKINTNTNTNTKIAVSLYRAKYVIIFGLQKFTKNIKEVNFRINKFYSIHKMIFPNLNCINLHDEYVILLRV